MATSDSRGFSLAAQPFMSISAMAQSKRSPTDVKVRFIGIKLLSESLDEKAAV
jgi:hypothetical protein